MSVTSIFLYRLFYFIFFFLTKFLFHIDIYGKKNIPTSGAYILVANHFSLLDPVVLTVCTRRIIHWIVASWAYELWYLSVLVKRLPFIKVERGKFNKGAIKKCKEILRKGELLGVFPEGGLSRTPRLGDFLRGVSFLAITTNTPIIPIYIQGSYNALPPGSMVYKIKPRKVRVSIGTSFYLPADIDFNRANLIIREKIEKERDNLVYRRRN